MQWWVWVALDDDGRLRRGEQAADAAPVVRAVLSSRGLDALLILMRERWAADLAGGPAGVPAPVRSAAEIALLRADGDLELPPMHGTPRPADSREPRHRVPRLRRARSSGRSPAAATQLAVHARPWSRTLVSVAMRGPGGEVLDGTERLYGTDDDGLAAAAEWKGQLEYVLEGWLADCGPDGELAPDDSPDLVDDGVDEINAPNAEQAARLLDGPGS